MDDGDETIFISPLATPQAPSVGGHNFFASPTKADTETNDKKSNIDDDDEEDVHLLEIPVWPPPPPEFPPKPVIYASEFAGLVACLREKFAFVTPLNIYDFKFSKILLDLPEVRSKTKTTAAGAATNNNNANLQLPDDETAILQPLIRSTISISELRFCMSMKSAMFSHAQSDPAVNKLVTKMEISANPLSWTPNVDLDDSIAKSISTFNDGSACPIFHKKVSGIVREASWP